MEIFLQPSAWLSLITLIFIEIVLGIDNIVFLVIVSMRLPKEKQKTARRLGLALATISRLLLLASIVWLAGLTSPLFSIGHFDVSVRNLLMFFGGVFLVYKAWSELRNLQQHATVKKATTRAAFGVVILEIILFDLLFSLDSIITAVGIADHFIVMAIAIMMAILVMLFASEAISRYIEKRPRVKILALCLLILVGVELMLDGLHVEIPVSYLFTAMGFALLVELVNQWRGY